MHVIVAAGGDPLAEKWHLDIPADAICIAADSGLAHIYALGRVPTIVVGDLDSVDDADLARARREGTRIDRYPADKDATDLELALARAQGSPSTVTNKSAKQSVLPVRT